MSARKRATKPPPASTETPADSGIHRAAKRAGIKPTESEYPSFRHNPEIGACPHDVRVVAGWALDCFGVDARWDEGRPTPATILKQGILRELSTLELVIADLEVRDDNAIYVLGPLRDRLEFLAETAEILSSIVASTPAAEREGAS